MSSDAKKLKQSKPVVKTRKGHGMVTPKPHAKWTQFVDDVRKELGWSLDQMCDLTGMKMGWVKKARRGGDVSGDFRENFQNAINACWEEKFPNKPKHVWPDWVDDAPWSEPNSGTEEKTPHNLPDAPAQFFGHIKLRRGISARLCKKGLVVLHETGGMGKTTFANQVAHDAMKRQLLLGGAVWINCETSPSVEECLRNTAGILLAKRATGLRDEELEKSLRLYLANRHTLLVFDNFETVIHQDAFNQLLRDYAGRACLLVTTRIVHDGMKENVLPFSELRPNDGFKMFLHEAGITRCSAADQEVIKGICASVGYLPLGILVLAHQAPQTTLAQLAKELEDNFALLATNDRFLEPRHRSMAACFQVSFNRLDGQDGDTLYRLSVVPAGLGKAIARDYLDKRNWISSLSNCVTSALLRLEDGRYNFHPLVRSFLHAQMRDQKSDWEHHFVDFFCARLDTAANERRIPEIAEQEAENCRAALHEAKHLSKDEYFLLVRELIKDPEPSPLPQPTVFRTRGCDPKLQEWKKRDHQLLESTLADAKVRKENPRVERILKLKLTDARSPLEVKRVLRELSRVSPRQGEAIQLDLTARTHFAHREWRDAEKVLEKSIVAWQSAGPAFFRDRLAAILNHLAALIWQDKGREAAAEARTLRSVLSEECLFSSEYLDEDGEMFSDLLVEWFCAVSPQEEMRTMLEPGSGDRLKYDLTSLQVNIGTALCNLKQWSEAATWLEIALPALKHGPYSNGMRWRCSLTTMDSVSLDLAKALTNSGQYHRSESVYEEIRESLTKDPSAFVLAYWLEGVACLDAKYADFISAVRFARQSLTIFEEELRYINSPKYLADDKWIGARDWRRSRCTREIRYLRSLIPKWSRKIIGRKQKSPCRT